MHLIKFIFQESYAMPKLYIHTNQLNTKLPEQFIQGKNRYIHFLHCRLLYNNALSGDISCHSIDIVKEYPYLDGFLWWANYVGADRYKWKIEGTLREFNLSFRHMGTTLKTINNGDFVLSLLLEWD